MRARLSLCIALMLVTGITAGSATAELVAYYPFGEGQGTATADATGNGNNGTLSSGVEWVPGVKGGAVHFDTAGERIVTTALDPTAKNNAMTLAAWINWEGQGHSTSQQGIVGKREGWDPGTGVKWFWQTNPAGALLFRADNAQGGTGLWWGNGRLVPYANEWTHVAVTWDNGAAVQYVNAVQTDTGNVTFRDTADATIVSIGCVSATNNETFVGSIDEVRIYDTALTAAEITQAMTGDTAPASAPQPASGATDVPREVVFSWAPGEFAASHDVYFGTDFDAVDQAGRTDDRGVLVSTGQGPTSYDPDGLLEFGQMYYWRIDEVNAPPDNSISKGQIWSFTAEPYAYPIANITATASSSQVAANGPQNTVNGSGLTNDLHSTASAAMWLSSITAPQPAWIQYAFTQPYRLHELWVWNYNAEFEPVLGYGFKDVTIEYSLDGTNWTALGDVPEFAQATAQNGYAHNTTVDLQGVMAQYVRLTANSNWSPVGLKQYGLSEVRFYYVPVKAREPRPADGAEGVSLDAALSWRPGREAVTHDVYFSSDQQAVVEGTALVDTVSANVYQPSGLEYGKVYYWKVNEVNDAASPSVREGDVWSFVSTEFSVVDDFESYTDDQGSRIYETWIDGYTNGLSGSTVGYFEAPFAEQTIVNSGNQSMPLEYNNVNTPYFSEAEREFSPVQNWTGNGATHLSLWFRGRPAAFIDRGGNAFAVSGGGHDIWDNADDFRFIYKRLSGNGSLTAKVESLTNTNAWAKAGVMIRETLDDVSRHATMVVTPANSCSFQRRESTNGASTGTNWSGTAVEAPYWVRITRTGNSFKGESSPDGKTWTALGADVAIAMGADVYIGLCVTSHDAAQICAAEFSDVATTGSVTGSWQMAAIGDDPQPANAPDKLYVVVQDSAGKSKAVTHPDPSATTAGAWQQWLIPLSEFTSAGVKVTGVAKLYLGVGDRANPQKGGAGLLYIDDIAFGRPAPTP